MTVTIARKVELHIPLQTVSCQSMKRIGCGRQPEGDSDAVSLKKLASAVGCVDIPVWRHYQRCMVTAVLFSGKWGAKGSQQQMVVTVAGTY